MSALVGRRRRRTVAAALAGLLVAAALPAAALVGARTIANNESSVDVTARNLKSVPTTPVAFLGTVDGNGLLTSITVFVLAPEGRGGTIVSVPVGSRLLGIEGDDPDNLVRIGDVYAQQGLDAFSSSLRSLLYVSFAAGEVLDRTETASYLSSLTNVEVSFPVDLVDTTEEGDVVVLPAGASTLDSFDIADVLLAARTSSTESARLPWVRGVWEAVADYVGPGRAPADEAAVADGLPQDLRSFIASVLSGPVTAYQLGYTPVTVGGAREDAPDVYELDIGEVVLVFASVAPSSVVVANPSVTVQLDSSFDFETTKSAVTRLLFIGANVLLVRTVDEPPEDATRVLSVNRLGEQEVTALERMLGELDLSDQDDPVEGIDVQIVLGRDFVDRLAAGAPAPGPTADDDSDDLDDPDDADDETEMDE